MQVGVGDGPFDRWVFLLKSVQFHVVILAVLSASGAYVSTALQVQVGRDFQLRFV